MRLTLSLLEAPAREPITLEDVRRFLKLDHSEDDPILKNIIASARVTIENYTNRALLHQTWRAFYSGDDSFNCLRLPLPRAPFYELKDVPKARNSKGGERPVKEAVMKTNHVIAIENELRQKLSMRLEIKLFGQDRGQIVLRFENNDDFERLLEILRR